MPLSPRISVLILQHPQEPDHLLGSAPLLKSGLENSTLKIGLSWKNLSAALGKPAEPSKWAVLYLGSGVKGAPPQNATGQPAIQFVSKAGVPVNVDPKTIEGLVVLDGTWSQAKTLWWRNAWLLKLKRVILFPTKPSLYGTLRKEPRRECLSTLESTVQTLTALGEDPQIGIELTKRFEDFLNERRNPR